MMFLAPIITSDNLATYITGGLNIAFYLSFAKFIYSKLTSHNQHQDRKITEIRELASGNEKDIVELSANMKYHGNSIDLIHKGIDKLNDKLDRISGLKGA